MKLFWMFAVLILMALLALLIGKYSVPIGTLFHLSGTAQQQETARLILTESRLPRVLAAVVVGGSLSVAGAVYQGIFRNPLVSPDILGASSGSAFGAALGILLGRSIAGIEMFSFICGLCAVGLTWFVATVVSRGRSSLVLILSGILISTVFSSLISLIKFTADPYSKLPDITFWLLGSLSAVSISEALFISVCALAGLIPILAFSWKINVLSLKDDEARSLGVNTTLYTIVIVIGATLITSASVSICGLIGWVGLIVPHIVRSIFGPNYRTLVVASTITGGAYLLGVDTIARAAFSLEIPLGIITSLIGAPFFMYLMSRTGRGWA